LWTDGQTYGRTFETHFIRTTQGVDLKTIVGIFIDFSKAFDAVDHDTVLNKISLPRNVF